MLLRCRRYGESMKYANVNGTIKHAPEAALAWAIDDDGKTGRWVTTGDVLADEIRRDPSNVIIVTEGPNLTPSQAIAILSGDMSAPIAVLAQAITLHLPKGTDVSGLAEWLGDLEDMINKKSTSKSLAKDYLEILAEEAEEND